MNEARLIVEPSTISVRASAPATGDIAIAVRDVVFPSAGWNDFVVVVLEAWLGALVRLLRNSSDEERVHFMEGPYALEIARLATGALRVRAVERPARERAVAEVMPVDLAADAISAADGVVAWCRGRCPHSKDLARLESALAELRCEVAATGGH